MIAKKTYFPIFSHTATAILLTRRLRIGSKIILSIVLSLLLVCSLAPISAFAASEEQSTEKVGVFVEVVDEDLSSLYDFSTPRRARSVVDLSTGQDTFTVGTLQANSTYRTNTYSITKSTIKIGLQSLAGASPHIKVTLYKSNGVSVAATTMDLPWSSPMSGGTTYVSFTNLDTAYNYYAVIQNMDTVQTGTILGIAKQK